MWCVRCCPSRTGHAHQFSRNETAHNTHSTSFHGTTLNLNPILVQCSGLCIGGAEPTRVQSGVLSEHVWCHCNVVETVFGEDSSCCGHCARLCYRVLCDVIVLFDLCDTYHLPVTDLWWRLGSDRVLYEKRPRCARPHVPIYRTADPFL